MKRKSTWFLAIALIGSGFAWWQTYGGGDDLGLPELDKARDASLDKVDPSKQAKLELNVAVGERFPLLKTVEQELTQFTGSAEQRSRSKLQLLLSITVEDIAKQDRPPIPAGSRLFSVQYQSVKYSHDIAGEHVEYDSTKPQFPLAEAVQAYHGLVNNSFQFWLGPDNQIAQLVGFNEFLERCVQHVPFDRRRTVFSHMIANSGDDEVANFIDDSIGLLPYDADSKYQRTVQIGQNWKRERQVFRPIPMFLANRYMLTDLTDRFARISIVGDVTPARVMGPTDQPKHDVDVTIVGGKTIGSCTIDRSTGLPMESEIERQILMNVDLGGGNVFRQHKRIASVIRTFQQQDQLPRGSNVKRDIIQASKDSGAKQRNAGPRLLEPHQTRSAVPQPKTGQ